jgi:hypothetical protein
MTTSVNAPLLVSRTQLAEELKLSRKQVDRYHKSGAFKPVSTSPLRFDLAKCVEVYRKKKAKSEELRTGGVDKLTAQLRKARADLEESELKLSRLHEDIVPADELEAAWEGNRAACLERIRKFPTEIASALMGVERIAEVSDILETAMRQVLTDLSEIKVTEDRDNEPTSKTSKSSNRSGKAGRTPEVVKLELEAMQAQIYHSRAGRKELGNCLIDARAFQTSDVERVLGQWIGSAKARLWAIPNTMPRLLVGHTTAEAIQAALSKAVEEAAAELRPFDAEAFKSRSIDYTTVDPEEEG